MLDLGKVRDEARRYAIECNDASRPVSLCELALRLGYSRQWLSSGKSLRATTLRDLVLREWHEVGVKAHNRLAISIAEIGGVKWNGKEPNWAISPDQWPAIDHLPRILSTAGRREMFAHLRNNYGRSVAMRYAYVCAHPPAKGGRVGNQEVADAVV